MRSAGREPGPRRSPRWRRAVVPLCEASGGGGGRRGDQHPLRGDDDGEPHPPRHRHQHQQQHREPQHLQPVRRGLAAGSSSSSSGAMKGKERSPVKPKRSRGGGGDDSSSSRGERSKKLGGSGGSNGSSSGGGGKSGESSRRSLHLDKSRSSSRGGSREYDTGGGGSSRSLRAYSSPSAAKNSSGGGGESRGSSRGRGGGGESRASGAAGSSSSSSAALDGGEYKTLKISELGSQLSDEAVEDGLFHEFKRFGDVSVKISRLAGAGGGGGGDEQRVAFVNFRRAEDARAAKHARGRLVLYDRPLKIEAVYASRRRSRSPLDKDAYGLSSSLAGMSVSGHRHAHAHAHAPGGGGQRSLSPGAAALGYRDYRLQQLALGRLPPPPPPPLPRELDRDRDYQFYDRVRPAYSLEPRVGAGGGGGGGAAAFREADEISPEDDQRANRTLFLGNLDITVTESDLRRAFDRFGVITEVDIKRPSRGQTSTYGFLKFENLDMSHRAKLAMSGKIIIRNPIKIGYGKATPTTRLWVGGLGPWVPLAALAREFDRFGTIRTIDYRKGDSWAYIQYESLDAAHAAWTHMRGFPLGGPDRRLRVDFADTEHRYQQQYLQPLPLAHYDLVTDAFGHRAPDPLRGARDRTPPLLYRDRDRDLYPDSDWAPPPPPVRERSTRTAASAVPAYEPLDSLDRRRDGWSLDRDRGDRDLPSSRDQPRKRRLAEDSGGRHQDRSPESDRPRKRHCAPSPDRSPEPSSARDRYNSDNDRASRLLLERPSPIRDRRGSLEKSQGDKRDRKNSASAERDRKHRAAAPTEGKSPLKKEDRAEGSAASTSAASSKLKAPTQKQESGAASAAAASPKLCLAWQGMLLLKNSNFPSNMHLLQGDLQVASSLLVEGATGGKVAQLKITQRLRLDQPKLDEVTRRIKVAGPNGYAILLAVPGSSDSRSSASATSDTATSTQRPLRNLVSYLKQKQAAGVISLPVGGNKDKENTGVLHAFPPCEFSQQFLDSPAKALAKSEEDYLVMIIVRGTTLTM
ncbi:RNA-binding protein 15 [Suncus etruscus]|uniref:RNA-binding protein 15 n=1 Tax=Suncus etruscus TaxID=109475 RepID=UPI0021101C91|nr:RNA-binding protein 15 [Suncus etruscus]